MADLTARTPCSGVLPFSVGSVTLEETDPGALTSIAAYNGQQGALSDALDQAHGVKLPAANRTTGRAECRAIWFGRDMALLAGPPPDPRLAQHAALTDQSDAWAVVTLSGDGAADVLARLVPADLRSAVFKRGHTLRTQVMHMNASITRTGADSFMIMVFRSMAHTLVDELKTAMEGVAARG
ncbi:sarcosine oxidase subunit gamma [uncultured Roseobacter sp.]|uniref:sarcosine oxidase subunit gamma n=1 Tax=uncultured Roseobacter sp. TaxID=114847 RepID=UPI0026200F32|nr:sarcosine oxidase subunit gamma [uncultured Roseobacter sp.]